MLGESPKIEEIRRTRGKTLETQEPTNKQHYSHTTPSTAGLEPAGYISQRRHISSAYHPCFQRTCSSYRRTSVHTPHTEDPRIHGDN